MNKGVLLTIKIVVIFIVFILMGISKEIGVPIIVKNIIGLGIIYAVWKYKPDEPNNNNSNRQLDKS